MVQQIRLTKTAWHCSIIKCYPNRSKVHLLETMFSHGFGVTESCYGSRLVHEGWTQNKLPMSLSATMWLTVVLIIHTGQQ